MPSEKPTAPDVRHVALTERQVKKALLALFKQEIRETYTVDSFALVSTGKLVVKLTKA